MLREVNPRGRGARPPAARLRHSLGAGKRPRVRPDRSGGVPWFMYGAYRAAGEESLAPMGPS